MTQQIESGVQSGGAIRMVVFDMAGTTVFDGENTVAHAIADAMHAAGFPTGIDAVDRVMGLPKPLAIRELLHAALDAQPDEALVTAVHDDFRRRILAHYRDDATVRSLGDAERVFAMFRDDGIRVTLDTGFDRETADTIIERLGWTDLIDDSVTSDEVEEGRPAPDMIRALMARAGITNPSEVAKVGDSVSDIEEGLNAGCGFVAAVVNSRTRDTVGKYPGVAAVRSIAEMPGLIRSLAVAGE